MAEESFVERLRRLRRDPPKPVPVPTEQAQGHTAEWLRARLERRRCEQRPRRAAAGTPPALDPRHKRSLGRPCDLVAKTGPRGAYAERILRRPAADRHGDFSFDEVDAACDLGLLARDAALDGLDPRNCVYLDIETTGLSGGAGTWPFMVGLGRFDGDEFELWQGFMMDPSEEPGLLEETARRIAAAGGVVSFFGKSFDRHRLEDKMRVHGIHAPFEGRPHLDLYHPLNRLYTRRAVWDRVADGASPPEGGGLADGKLGTMERALLGLERGLDLSGAHAPAAWFDFLAGRAHLLEEVFRHNALDVWSLAVLLGHLGRTLAERRSDGGELSGPKLARALGLASLARDRCDRPAELEHLGVARDRLGAAALPAGLALWSADALRLGGAPEEALQAYAALEASPALDDRRRAASAAERAKLLEHHRADHAAALVACEVARQAALRGRSGARFLAGLDKRASRLEARLSAPGSLGRSGA